MINVKRGILVFGCAAAFAAAPLVAASPAAAKDCPYGTVPTKFEGVCVQGQAGGFGAPGVVVPPQAGAPGADVVYNPNGVGSVNGIPCTPEHYGTCIGLQQSQG
ncbi:hypothetical protein [Mycolicibacterium sp. 050158]|jgi:hypothetical protein|uniref:hypothetical protein n=1 Tax=Mycolicibacterium sp. 050158 TaxID=3090602 RepID=UPI00299DC7BF|nr:hypothetical protein [Mycolicibacterium sp. 050158]MDX1891747.1 hypothetical protein [Mycolicibacterium sp. 050158]